VAIRREGKGVARAAAAEAARRRARRRALLSGTIVAAALVGFGAGWLVQRCTGRPPEERAHEKAGEVRERVREATH
jgi:F0F1-type ATP synthase assembly protein I